VAVVSSDSGIYAIVIISWQKLQTTTGSIFNRFSTL